VECAAELRDAIVAPHQRVVGVGSIDASPPPACCVAWWDDAAGTRQAVDHLAEFGHECIAYLPGPPTALDLWPNMVAAFERTCDARGVRHTVVHSDTEHPSFAAGVQMALRALDATPRPTALFARNDDFALGVLNGLSRAGVDVPGEMSVVGYNEAPVAAYTDPALTTIAAPIVDATRAVVGALIDALDGEPGDNMSPTASRQFSTRLVVRGSTGPAPVQQRRRS
jgi:LacI family transcriptional regulator